MPAKNQLTLEQDTLVPGSAVSRLSQWLPGEVSLCLCSTFLPGSPLIAGSSSANGPTEVMAKVRLALERSRNVVRERKLSRMQELFEEILVR